jgi:hypothetical protein
LSHSKSASTNSKLTNFKMSRVTPPVELNENVQYLIKVRIKSVGHRNGNEKAGTKGGELVTECAAGQCVHMQLVFQFPTTRRGPAPPLIGAACLSLFVLFHVSMSHQFLHETGSGTSPSLSSFSYSRSSFFSSSCIGIGPRRQRSSSSGFPL